MNKAGSIEIHGHTFMRALVFLEGGKYLLSGGDDGLVRQWRVSDGVEVGERMKAGSNVTALDLSSNGEWIVSGGQRVANVWSLKSRQIVLTVSEHSDWVDTVHVSPDSRKLATGSNDKSAFIWDLSTGKRLVGPLEHEDRVGAVKFSPDGNHIATCTARRGLRIYDAHNGGLLSNIPVSVTSYLTPLAWSTPRSIFALVSQRRLLDIDVDIGQAFSSWTIPGDPVTSSGPIAYGSIVLSGNGKFIVSFAGRSVSFWDASTSAQISSDILHPANIASIALSSDNNYLAISDWNNKIVLHKLQDIVSNYYLDGQRVVQQPRNRHGNDLQPQIEALNSQLRTLQLRVDELSGTTAQSNHTEAQLSCLIGIPDGSYRIKSNTGDLYLTCSDDAAGPVVAQHLDMSGVSQKWTVSLAVDGAYVIGHGDDSDVVLGIGSANALVCVPFGGHTTWTIEPRGCSYVIGNAEDARAIDLSEHDHGVSVTGRNNSPNQRWILEHVTN